MKTSRRRCKCLNCKELFLPDYRNRGRQNYCSKAKCKKARKQASQKAWLSKPENQNYFRDGDNARRVRQWQKEHPGYWKRTARGRRRTLQDACSQEPIDNQGFVEASPARTLQDLCSRQLPLLVGVLSM